MNALQPNPSGGGGSLIRTVVDLALDYVRWSQFVPMLTVWGFTLLMVVALTVVNLQEQGADPIGTGLGWIVQLPWVGEYLRESAGKDGTVHLSDEDLKSFLMTAWAALSLVGMLLGIAWRAAMGEHAPWPLKRKIGASLLGCLLLMGAMVANLYSHRDLFNGGTGEWLLMFTGVAALVFIVSLWSLTVTHVIDRARTSMFAAARLPGRH